MPPATVTGSGTAPIEIPKGEPDALADAARAWGHLADRLTSASARTVGAGNTALESWKGTASGRFLGTCTVIGGTLDAAAEGARDAASAARRFSRELRDAQRDAKAAVRAWEQAEDEQQAAIRAAGRARATASAERSAASSARGDASTARASSSPTAESTAQGHDDAARRADDRAAAAAAEQRRAEHRREEAERDQERAVRAGERANRQAERAARAAASAFSAATGRLESPPDLGVPPVPVTPSGGVSPFPGGAPGFGSPFKGLTPGDVRKTQIDAFNRRLAELSKSRKGSIPDGLSGLVHTATLGAVDPGGDKDSDRYRGGELAGLIPLPSAGGGLASLGKRAVKAFSDLSRAEKAKAEAEMTADAAKAYQKAKRGQATEVEAQRAAAAVRRAHREAAVEKAVRADKAAKLEQGLEVLKRLADAGPLVSSDVTALVKHVYTMWELYAPYLSAAGRAAARQKIQDILRRLHP